MRRASAGMPCLAAAAVALVAALSFSAARTALRRLASRLVYGEREDPYEVLRQLGRRLESASSAEAALNQVVSTLERTLRLAHAAIEVPGLQLTSSSRGVPGPAAAVIELNPDLAEVPMARKNLEQIDRVLATK